jgi:uncharacterized protein YbaR (Trm112 family)
LPTVTSAIYNIKEEIPNILANNYPQYFSNTKKIVYYFVVETEK